MTDVLSGIILIAMMRTKSPDRQDKESSEKLSGLPIRHT